MTGNRRHRASANRTFPGIAATGKSGLLAALTVAVLLLASCSTSRNTAGSRFYHSMVARYNTYFNGKQAYDKGAQSQEKARKDNMLEIPDLYPMSDKKVMSVGKSDFDLAIEKAQKAIKLHSITAKPKKKDPGRQTEKDKQWQARNEYNPFLWNAWMLMADAQAHEGEFIEAASTYSYIARLYADEPDIASIALGRMAWCYAQLEWVYESDELFSRTVRMESSRQTQMQLAALKASALIRQERFSESLPYMEQAIGRKGVSRSGRMKELYLLGQLYKQNGMTDKAQQCYGKLLRMSPPYDLEFHARIRQTETMASGQNSRKALGKLERMLDDQKNKDRLDQVYYAMGNIMLLENDTLRALGYYEKGAEASDRSTPEKGVLLLTMAKLYWNRANYEKAGKCYSQAVGMIGSDHKEFETVKLRSQVLEELNSSITTIHLQDSLQWLATLPDTQVIRIIDKVIEDLILKEEQQREDSIARAGKGDAGAVARDSRQESGGWYFYNSQAVERGSAEFQKQWGQRKLEDDWRRQNKSVLSGADTGSGHRELQADTKGLPVMPSDSTLTLPDSIPEIKADPHERQYYLDMIPYSEEALEKSDRAITRSLLDAGLIYKDKLAEYGLAESTLSRLVNGYPTFEEADDAAYNLYLMYSLTGRSQMADSCIGLMKELFPESDFTLMLSDPDYLDNARYGRHREDSLYTITYRAYLDGDTALTRQGCEMSHNRYPKGANRDRFMFLDAALDLEQDNIQGFLSKLKVLVSKYPKNDISQYAGLIVKGVEEGKILQSSQLVSIWDFSGNMMNSQPDSLRPEFSKDRFDPFVFVLAYPDGEINENQLLFEMANYNFSNFMMRNFELNFSKEHGIGMLQIGDFLNFDEAFTYSRSLYNNPRMASVLEGIKALTISRKNLEILLKYYSFNEWQEFYEQTFLSIPQFDIDGGTLYEELEEPETPEEPEILPEPEEPEKPEDPEEPEEPEKIKKPRDRQP